MALTDQVQHSLAGFEKHFDLPAFSIDADDLFLRKRHIREFALKPVFPIGFSANADDLCGNWIFFSEHDIDGKQIFGAVNPALSM